MGLIFLFKITITTGFTTKFPPVSFEVLNLIFSPMMSIKLTFDEFACIVMDLAKSVFQVVYHTSEITKIIISNLWPKKVRLMLRLIKLHLYCGNNLVYIHKTQAMFYLGLQRCQLSKSKGEWTTRNWVLLHVCSLALHINGTNIQAEPVQ